MFKSGGSIKQGIKQIKPVQLKITLFIMLLHTNKEFTISLTNKLPIKGGIADTNLKIIFTFLGAETASSKWKISIKLSAKVIAEIGNVAMTLIEGNNTIRYLISSAHQNGPPLPPVKYAQFAVQSCRVFSPNAVETDNPKKHKQKKIITQADL